MSLSNIVFISHNFLLSFSWSFQLQMLILTCHMNQTLMTFDFYSVHVGLARYGNNNNIMNVQGANKNTFLMMFWWQIWSYLCKRCIWKNLKKQGKAWKPHIINLPTWAFYMTYTIETKINKKFEIKKVCNIRNDNCILVWNWQEWKQKPLIPSFFSVFPWMVFMKELTE